MSGVTSVFATISLPNALCVNSSGFVFVYNPSGLNVFNPAGVLLKTWTTITPSGLDGGLVCDDPMGLYGSFGNKIAYVREGTLYVIAGQSAAGYADGFSVTAAFQSPRTVTHDTGGVIYVVDSGRIRQLTCVPCPSSYYCSSGAPVLCPAGSHCPLSSISATLCSIGAFSAAGAATCTLCPAGTFTTSTGSSSCQQCPGGHYCPAGTSSWARLKCGRGNYCPDGSGAPTPCPYQVPPSGGWGALQVQGPAFLVETARCLNHCFWNFTSGDGMLSKC